MTLYKKILLVISLTLVSLFAVLYISSRLILLDSFNDLESHETIEHLQRARNAINENINALVTVAFGYAAWDDTYQFIADHNQAYIDENYLPSFYTSNEVNATIFLDSNDQVVFERAFDLDTEQIIPVPQELMDQLLPGSLLLNHSDPSSMIATILSLRQGAMIVISMPILTNDGQGPMNGTMVWVRYLHDQQIEYLAKTTRLNIRLEAVDSTQLPADFELARSTLLSQGENAFFVHPLNNEVIAAYSFIVDYYGRPVLILRVDVFRDIYMQGQDTLFYSLISLLIISVVFAAVILIVLERNVLRRLAHLSAIVTHIRNTGDLNNLVDVQGNDEIANLSNGLNSMLTALAQSTAQLQDAHDQLEQRVQERTTNLLEANTQLQQEIAERQQIQLMLAQAHDKALEALQLKTQILANISHDARTPLTIITLQAEMLQLNRYGESTPRQQKAFDSILLNTRQLLGFINNLLKEAQLNQQKLQLDEVEFAPRDILNEIAATITPLAERKNITLYTKIADDMPEKLYGDTDHVKQILMNLLNNAIKFTDQGSVTVQFNRVDSDHWAIHVKDSGRGIPTEAQLNIFEAFWQVDGSITREANRGVGLGLSIVKQLVSLMGGSITLESNPGCGSTFTITLPLKEKQGELTK